MKTALVTGSAGFIGRHFAKTLDQQGFRVIGCDIKTGDDALDLFAKEDYRFDLVVHAAADSPHRTAIDGKPETFVRNQLLDASLFDWSVRTKQRRVLYFSSSAVYPVSLQANATHGWLSEDDVDLSDAREPDASYGWCKLTGERLARADRTAGVAVTVVRPFSGYGADQPTDWPFGAFLDRAKRRADPFTVWGDGTQVRDWVHIEDIVSGALTLTEADTDEPVNLCSGVGTSMGELAALMASTAGYCPRIELRPDKPAGVAYRVGDPSRLHEHYRPRISIEEGVWRAIRG